jgi:hypothetical protein
LWSAALSLACGLALTIALIVSASFLAGVYGPVGSGGVVLFTLLVALVVPYLVALPLAQFLWLRGQRR